MKMKRKESRFAANVFEVTTAGSTDAIPVVNKFFSYSHISMIFKVGHNYYLILCIPMFIMVINLLIVSR